MNLDGLDINKTKKLVKGILYHSSKVTVSVVQLIETPSKIVLVKKKVQDYTSDQLEKEKLVQKLDHPNIVKYFRLYNSEKHKIMLIYMENLKKGSLRHIIKNLHMNKENKKDKSQLELFAGIIGYEILNGLYYMKKKKIFHRDLKPENICIGKSGEIKIVDFGSSTELSDYYCETEVGTRCYMAPEIYLKGKYRPDKSDIWSLGILLFEFVYGKHPFLNSDKFGDSDFIRNKYYGKEGFCLEFETCIPSFKGFIRSMLNFDYKKRKDSRYFVKGKDSFLKNRIIGNIYLKKDFIEFIHSFDNQKLI